MKTEMSAESWKQPLQLPENKESLELAFTNLAEGDYIKIRTVYEQEKDEEVEPKLEGRIKDVEIKMKRVSWIDLAIDLAGILTGGAFSAIIVGGWVIVLGVAVNWIGFEGYEVVVIYIVAAVSYICVCVKASEVVFDQRKRRRMLRKLRDIFVK